MKLSELKRPLVVIVGVHLVYAIIAILFKHVLLVDSLGYLMQAENLKQYGSWYAEQWNGPVLMDYFSIRPPLYALLLAGFSYVPMGWIWILVVQNLLSIFNCLTVYRLAIRWVGVSNRLNVLSLCALIFYPAQFIHANFVMTEIIFQSLLLGLFMLGYRFLQQPSMKLSLGIMVLLSLCLLTKPVSLFLPFLMLVSMCWGVYKQHQSIRLLLPLLGVFFTFHLICLQNKHATGYYHYSSIKNINQLKYNARFALADARGEDVADSVIASVVFRANSMNNYEERIACFDSAALAIFKQYPVSVLKVYAKGVIAFFVDPGRFEVYHFLGMDSPQNKIGLLHEVQAGGANKVFVYIKQIPWPILVVLLASLCWNMIVGCLFGYFMWRGTVHHSIRIWLGVIVLYIAVATGPVGVSRYRVPVEPLLILAVLMAHPIVQFHNTKSNHV